MKRFLLLVLVLSLMIPAARAAEPNGYQARYAMLKTLYEQNGQFACSPVSLMLALSMATEGAEAETRQQLLDFLGTDQPVKVSIDSYKEVKSANAAIVSDKIRLLDSYQALLLDSYQADIFPMADDVVRQVNDWARAHTDGMIPELLTEQPDEMLRLVLLNALVLDAEWESPFDPNKTADGKFHAPDGDVELPLMHKGGMMLYAEAEGAQAVRLPYLDSKLSMTVILPEAGGMDKVLDLIAADRLDWLGEFKADDVVELALPKLSIESSLDMKRLLAAMGVSAPFGDEADFSGITGRDELFISAILQKVRLDVDEEGTRAAAATGLMMESKGMVINPIEMTVDRPYILLIEGGAAQETLFAAVITDPSKA